jgi:hypothetical protein
VQERPNSFCGTAGFANHTTHVIRVDPQFDCLALFSLDNTHLYILGVLHEFFGYKFYKILHCTIPRCARRVGVRRLFS